VTHEEGPGMYDWDFWDTYRECLNGFQSRTYPNHQKRKLGFIIKNKLQGETPLAC
jgi:hypothetical protein